MKRAAVEPGMMRGAFGPPRLERLASNRMHKGRFNTLIEHRNNPKTEIPLFGSMLQRRIFDKNMKPITDELPCAGAAAPRFPRRVRFLEDALRDPPVTHKAGAVYAIRRRMEA